MERKTAGGGAGGPENFKSFLPGGKDLDLYQRSVCNFTGRTIRCSVYLVVAGSFSAVAGAGKHKHRAQ